MKSHISANSLKTKTKKPRDTIAVLVTASQISLWPPRTNPSLESGIYLFFVFSYSVASCLLPGATSRLFSTTSGPVSNRVSFSFSFCDFVCCWVLGQHSVLVMLPCSGFLPATQVSLGTAPRWASQLCSSVTKRFIPFPATVRSLWSPTVCDNGKKAHSAECTLASVQGPDLVKLLPLQALTSRDILFSLDSL